MNPAYLAALLTQNEHEHLEFKQTLNLDTPQGKSKFVKEVLSLANSLQNGEEAYLIVGIEDKTKKLIGLEKGLPEERIQQIVADWCHPPISLRVETVMHQGKRLGVITIFGGRAPHTAKKDAKDQQGKVLLREKEVYIRRGSTIDVATPEEVVAIAQARPTEIEAIASRLDRLNALLEDWIHEQRWSQAYTPEESSPNRGLETALIGMLSLGTALWAAPAVEMIGLVAFAAALFWSIALSVVPVTHFGIIRSLITAMLLGPLLAVSQRYIAPFAGYPAGMFVASVVFGGASGIIVAQIIAHLERKLLMG